MATLPANFIEENKEKSKRTLRFGAIALFVMLLNALLDFIRGLPVSGVLILMLTLCVCLILFIIYKGHTKGAITAIVFTVNPFLVMIAFAEGLKTGGYLFILPLLFALAFLMNNMRFDVAWMAVYFFVTTFSFCVCIFFCSDISNWQHITSKQYSDMFTINSILVVCLCAAFAFTGSYFEKKYEAALMAAKDKAELQEKKIKGQHANLQQIAFLNAHIIRSPLSNIMALTSLINAEEITNSKEKEMIEHLQTSAHRLDDAIREIVAMASDHKQT